MDESSRDYKYTYDARTIDFTFLNRRSKEAVFATVSERRASWSSLFDRARCRN